MKRSKLLSFILLLVATVMMTMSAQATVKTVKKTLYGDLSTREKKNSVLVKGGKTTIKVTEDGFLRFKAPYSGTYTFTFSNQTSAKTDVNSGFADFYDEEGNYLKVTTTGGMVYSANFHTKYRASQKQTKGAYLAKRKCKIDIVKSRVTYIYLSFDRAGTVDLTISGKKKNLPISISKEKLTLKEGKTYNLSVKNAPGTIKWSSSDKSVAKVYKSGKVKGFHAGTAVITAKVGKKKLTCKVTVKGTKNNSETSSGNTDGGSGSSDSGSASGGSGSSSGSSDDSSDSGSTGSGMVWIPRTGSKYHSHSGCSGMRSPSYVSLSDAIAWGYTACSRCW